MSVESPPAFLQAGSYGAEQTRRMIATLLQRGASVGSIAGGVVSATDCALTPPGSGMTVNVAPGELWVPGSTSTTQSGYYCRVSSTTSLAIAASDPTNPRIDTVIAQVQDAAYAGSTNSFQVAVVTGTPTAGATLTNLTGKGSVPASSLVIGYVLVPATATSIVSGDLKAVITSVLLGLAEPLGPWQTFTLLGGVTTPAPAAQVRINGAFVEFQGVIKNSTGASIPAGTQLATLPSSAYDPVSSQLPLFVCATSGAGTTLVQMGGAAIFYEGAANWAVNATIDLTQIRYPII